MQGSRTSVRNRNTALVSVQEDGFYPLEVDRDSHVHNGVRLAIHSFTPEMRFPIFPVLKAEWLPWIHPSHPLACIPSPVSKAGELATCLGPHLPPYAPSTQATPPRSPNQISPS